MTTTSRFDFGSGLDPDPAYQWDTKRQLFSLAEVHALPSAVLFLLKFAEGEGIAFGSVCLSVCLFVRTEFSCFSPQLVGGLRRHFHHRCFYSLGVF